MSKFEIWLSECKNIGAEVKRLAGEGDTGLFKTRTQYFSKYNFFDNAPKYYVWVNGVCVDILDNYILAHALFNKEAAIW